MQIYSLHVFYRKKRDVRKKNGVIKVEYYKSIARQGNVYNYIYLLHHKSLLTKKNSKNKLKLYYLNRFFIHHVRCIRIA